MGSTLFGKPKEEKKAKNINLEERQAETSAVSNLVRRVRILEERIYNLQRKFQLNGKSIIETSKTSIDGVKLLNVEVAEIKKEMSVVKEKMEKVIQELGNKANLDEFLVFKKYLELWKPVNFVTKNEVNLMIEDALKEKFKKSG
jgi:predicted  nucleic acid-binding Zn-ribbon protein